MNRYPLAVSILLTPFFVAFTCVGTRADSIQKTDDLVPGKVVATTPFEVEVRDKAGRTAKIPVNEIVSIFFEGESSAIRSARLHLKRGAYADALESLEKATPGDLAKKEIKEDIEFYKALCAAKLALAGTGTIKDAGGMMNQFVRNNPNSYHVLEANEIIGDLLVALGNNAGAETFYKRVAQAPWPEYQMRAGVAIGRARLAQPGKEKEAKAAFDAALKIPGQGEAYDLLKLSATLGLAQCLAADEPDAAVKMVNDILAKADIEDTELHARAYNALGIAHRKAGRNTEALMAFLHVDVLYFAVPEAHAEALYNLAQLWDKRQKPNRARRAKQILAEQYSNSRWSK